MTRPTGSILKPGKTDVLIGEAACLAQHVRDIAPGIVLIDMANPSRGIVSAYVMYGLQPERVVAAMDVAIIRFQMYHRMRQELETTRRALEERKMVNSAKAIPMKDHGINEGQG